MTLEAHPVKLADVMSRREKLLQAMSADPPDVKLMIEAMLDGVTRVEFVVGRNYRILTFGSRRIAPAPIGDDSKPVDVIEFLSGMAGRQMMESGFVQEIEGVYRGRLPQRPVLPHVFRAPNGLDAVLADMDLLAWERA